MTPHAQLLLKKEDQHVLLLLSLSLLLFSQFLLLFKETHVMVAFIRNLF